MGKEDKDIIKLNRGGFIIDTPSGYIQFGSPPETIKDSMTLPGGVPRFFVLPNVFFNWNKGMSVAEIEFPIYFNFFIKKQKVCIICQKEQHKRLLTVLQEAIFGPEKLNLKKDYTEGLEKNHIPNLKKELDYFRNNLKLEDLVEFVIFKKNTAKIEDISIKIVENRLFQLIRNNEIFAEVPTQIQYNPTYDIGKRLSDPFPPPVFGITCLGPSHGFDPLENTSGFILWLNRRGIMIDPPVNTTEWLLDSNVNPKLISSIILTHCHADHDAGTFQKILEEGKVIVYSTRTVMDSFLKKYSTFTNVTPEYLKKLFTFVPIRIGDPVYINCGRFDFSYSLHSIPTIGFRVNLNDSTFVYSSDHNNEPSFHKELLKKGVINENRYNELSSFPWDSDVIYHESGIAPLHTPITYLNSLEPEIQKKIVVYHIAKKDFPETTKMTLAQFGIEHTKYVEVESPIFEDSYHVLGLLRYLDFFTDIPISKAQDFLSIVNEESYKRGDYIIKKGTSGDKFFIIKSGNVSVAGNDLATKKVYGVFDYFGEVALVTSAERSADVIAATDVTAYTIEKDQFLHFIRGTELKNMLVRLSKVRNSETWNVLSTSSFFSILTSTQKTFLESVFHHVDIKKPGTIIKEKKLYENVYIIRKGTVDVFRRRKQVARLQRGDLIGAMEKIHEEEPSEYSFKNREPVSLYQIRKPDVIKFLETNPGLIMKLVYDFKT